MYIAWDADGTIIATLDALVYHDPATGQALGLADMQTHEASGGRMREIAEVEGAVASGTWIEELGGQAHDFRVELDPQWTRPDPAHPFAVQALVHRHSRVKRKRADAEKRILAAVKEAHQRGERVDLEPLIGVAAVGERDRHLPLGPDGRLLQAVATQPVEPPFALLRPRRDEPPADVPDGQGASLPES